MSVLVTSLDKCGGGVRDARVAEGAQTPLFSGLRHLEPQIVGTRRRGATSRGHEATRTDLELAGVAATNSTACAKVSPAELAAFKILRA